MIGNDPTLSIAENYRAFATDQARGRSPIYEAICLGVAEDQELLGFLGEFPHAKQQPNLFLAAVRYVTGIHSDYASFKEAAIKHGGAIAETMWQRRTQTNEPARCALLLPLLCALPQPLALLELGSSAGLTLLPDRYGYRYGETSVAAPTPQAPVFSCRAVGDVTTPSRLPEVAWRRGIDINPLDVTDQDDVNWLTALIWPGEGARQEQLLAAVAVARQTPPELVAGDLVDLFSDAAQEAPGDATLVVCNSASIAYISEERREDLADQIRKTNAVWLSLETPGVLPHIAVEPPRPDEHGAFLLVRDGTEPLAYCDSHGSWMRWLAG